MIIAAVHESRADGGMFVSRPPLQIFNRKIQLKSGLKTAHCTAEVKKKTINRNFVLKQIMISAHKTDKYGATRRQDLNDGSAK